MCHAYDRVSFVAAPCDSLHPTVVARTGTRFMPSYHAVAVLPEIGHFFFFFFFSDSFPPLGVPKEGY